MWRMLIAIAITLVPLEPVFARSDILGSVPNFNREELLGPRLKLLGQDPGFEDNLADIDSTLGPTPDLFREGLFGPVPRF